MWFQIVEYTICSKLIVFLTKYSPLITKFCDNPFCHAHVPRGQTHITVPCVANAPNDASRLFKGGHF